MFIAGARASADASPVIILGLTRFELRALSGQVDSMLIPLSRWGLPHNLMITSGEDEPAIAQHYLDLGLLTRAAMNDALRHAGPRWMQAAEREEQ